MFCQKCGENNTKEARFCLSCGTSLYNLEENKENFNISSNQENIISKNHEMNLVNSFKSVVFENYANFSGRASKSEFWWYMLASILVSIVTIIIDVILGTTFINGLVSLVLLIPGIAVATRRLHDTNRSGWWQLISITIIGVIPLIMWYVQSSDTVLNRFGLTPKE